MTTRTAGRRPAPQTLTFDGLIKRTRRPYWLLRALIVEHKIPFGGMGRGRQFSPEAVARLERVLAEFDARDPFKAGISRYKAGISRSLDA